MLRAALVLLFLALPDFVGDCLAATAPHIPPSRAVRCVSAHRGGRDDFAEDERPDGSGHDREDRCRCCGLLGKAPAVIELLDLCDRVAGTDSTILISGETGTGKDLLARCIHMHSGRAAQKLTTVACGAIPESLVESELFGHRRGSFTGAVCDQAGLIERADGGTLVLDEVESLSGAAQAKLLRVVEDHRIQKVGGGHDLPVNFRLIAATNADLAALVESGSFREDLFYRLNVIHIALPALRERAEDVPRLALHFRDRFSRDAGLSVIPFSVESMDWLTSREWPGNVRQLKHCVERAVLMSRGEDEITPQHMGHCSRVKNGGNGTLALPLALGWDLRRLEAEYMEAALKYTNGHRGRAADLLGIDRRTLYRKLRNREEISV